MPNHPGRPSGHFTQHRRLDHARAALARSSRGLTYAELALALDVSVRTARRYMDELGHEFDLEPTRVDARGTMRWRVRQSDVPRKVELRRTQAYALLAARRVFEPLRGTTLYDEIELATNRIMEVAQRPGRGPNAGLADSRLEERFLYLPYAPKNYARKTAELEDLFQAVSDLRVLKLLYRSSGKKEERITIHPYAMVLHRDSIYCVGLHVGRGEIRTFLLDRMRNTEPGVTERFALPDDFHIDAYFQGEFGIWRSPGEEHEVVIDFDALARENVRMRRVHATQTFVPLPDGGVRLTLCVGSLTPLVGWILEWGSHARAVAPPELVEQVRSELQRALGAYES